MPRGLTFPLLALVALICVRAHAVIDTGPELPESARSGPVDRPHVSAAHRNVRESGRDDEDDGDEIAADVQQPEEGGRTFPSFEESESYKELKCGEYDVTYEQIERDLAIHRELGTHYNSTRYIIKWLHRRNGMPIGFFGGRAYLLMKSDWKSLAHHSKLHVAYLRMIAHLERTFGAAIPDVVLVVSSSDTPRYVSPRLVNVSSPEPQLPPTRDGGPASKALVTGFVPGPYPVAGICKSDFWSDLLLIPNFHFHMKSIAHTHVHTTHTHARTHCGFYTASDPAEGTGVAQGWCVTSGGLQSRLYDGASLAPIPAFREKHPWATRKPVLFGRFSHYHLVREPADESTYKLGLGGEDICKNENTTCMGREHFITKVVKQDRERMDVKFSGMQPMAGHTRFKYLVNLNGQSISSRLEQLLPLGSVVFTEATSVGYYAYYYRTLLKHRVNVLEFWRRVPEEVFEELDWAQEHDQEAAAIAAEGGRTAATYLTGNARACYWFRLLHGLSRTLRFRPRLDKWPGARLVQEVLNEDLPLVPGGPDLIQSPWAP